jgi:hypothetical protein
VLLGDENPLLPRALLARTWNAYDRPLGTGIVTVVGGNGLEALALTVTSPTGLPPDTELL